DPAIATQLFHVERSSASAPQSPSARPETSIQNQASEALRVFDGKPVGQPIGVWTKVVGRTELVVHKLLGYKAAAMDHVHADPGQPREQFPRDCHLNAPGPLLLEGRGPPWRVGVLKSIGAAITRLFGRYGKSPGLLAVRQDHAEMLLIEHQ